MKIDTEIIVPNVYLLEFETKYNLCMSLVRMQEFYESDSDRFKNKYFTLEEYIDYWSLKFGKGAFTYPRIWNGFNIPGEVLKRWIDLFVYEHNDIRDKENRVITDIQRLMDEEKEMIFDGIYVIATHDNIRDSKEAVINHELSHAFFHMYPAYREECIEMIAQLDKEIVEKAKSELSGTAYSEDVFEDEITAFFSTKTMASMMSDALGVKDNFVEHFEVFKREISEGCLV